MMTPELITDSLSQCTSRQQPIGLYHLALGVDRAGLHGVEPRAPGGQRAGQNAYTLSCRLDLAVMPFQPRLYLAAAMPGGVIPHQQQGLLAQDLQLAAGLLQKSHRDPAHGTPIDPAQPYLLVGGFLGRCPAEQEPIAGQGLGPRVLLGEGWLYHTPRAPGLRPGMQAGAGPAAPPGLIFNT
jgi:hypothetical protein